jgi:rSAM/selenodomain-associated transferase 2
VNYSFSIIIPVLNEALIINETIRQLYQRGEGLALEVMVVDGDPEGRTINAIQNHKVIKMISPRGRGKQMNKGASLAQNDILLFLHTDTELPADAFRRISSAVEKQECAGGAFHLGIKSDRAVFRFMEKVVAIRTRLTGIPYGDQAIFIKKEIFHKMGGYREIPLMEDVELMRRIKKAGHHLCIIPEKVKTSPRRWEKEGILYCTLRNWALITLYLSGVNPGKLVKFYYRDWNSGEEGKGESCLKH